MASVCVFCSSSEEIDPRHLDLAARVGAEIGRRGHRLVSGGGRVSMMGALAQAARAAGGQNTGVIPQALLEWEVADTDADDLVVTADMRERKGRMDAAADAFLALPGGLGTLEELLEIWVAYTLGLHGKPIVVLDPDGVYQCLAALVEDLVSAGFVRPAAAAAIDWADSPEQALGLIERRLAEGSEGRERPGDLAAAAAGDVHEALEAEL